jgi:hypothetical protein
MIAGWLRRACQLDITGRKAGGDRNSGRKTQ